MRGTAGIGVTEVPNLVRFVQEVLQVGQSQLSRCSLIRGVRESVCRPAFVLFPADSVGW